VDQQGGDANKGSECNYCRSAGQGCSLDQSRSYALDRGATMFMVVASVFPAKSQQSKLKTGASEVPVSRTPATTSQNVQPDDNWRCACDIHSVRAAALNTFQGRFRSQIPRRRKMIDTRYKKINGMHAGHTYKVKAPTSETDSPMRWSLQNEGAADDRLIVSEDDLKNPKLWQALS
jgi:hypothetical protein